MSFKEGSNEKQGLLDYQQNSEDFVFEDSVYPTNQEYVVVNPEEVLNDLNSREYPATVEYSDTILLDPIH